MKKHKIPAIILFIYILLIATLLLLSGCIIYRKFEPSTNCPINNKKYFYKQMGVKPPRSYLKNNR